LIPFSCKNGPIGWRCRIRRRRGRGRGRPRAQTRFQNVGHIRKSRPECGTHETDTARIWLCLQGKSLKREKVALVRHHRSRANAAHIRQSGPHVRQSRPEWGTCKTLPARIWPCLQGKSFQRFKLFPLDRRTGWMLVSYSSTSRKG